MDKNLDTVILKRLEKTARALKNNNMQVYVVDNKEAAYKKVSELINKGDKIGVGGSVTLDECGILHLVRDKQYNFIDRYEKGLSAEDIKKRHIEALGADVYITGTNAITEDGKLYNVDGNGNRLAAIIYGPTSVIVLAGYNKIVKNIDEAINHVRRIAAPANCIRLTCKTYCAESGECIAFSDKNAELGDGCNSDGRICCDFLVSAKQRHKDRIKVILIKEELGF